MSMQGLEYLNFKTTKYYHQSTNKINFIIQLINKRNQIKILKFNQNLVQLIYENIPKIYSNKLLNWKDDLSSDDEFCLVLDSNDESLITESISSDDHTIE